MIEIKRRFSGEVIFSVETDSFKSALEVAVRKGVDLRGVDLRGADLRGANFRGVDLRGVNLRGTNLRGVDLQGAKNIMQINGDIPYVVTLTKKYVLVGCEHHTWQEWKEFKEDELAEMNGLAVEWHPKLLKLMDVFESQICGEG